MRDITRFLLWVFVFTVPWDNFPLPLAGSVSRISGLAAVGAAVLTTTIEGRLRKPDLVLGFAMAFGMWVVLSLLWTLSYGSTVILAITFAQLVASVWVIREFIRTREQVETLLVALCLGLFVPLIDLLNNFRLGVGLATNTERFTAVGMNANSIGLLLVLGLPIAWHLLMQRRGLVRIAGLIYVVMTPAGLLLTSTRGAVVAGIAALSIVPLTLPRRSVRSFALVGALLIGGTLTAAQLVPRYSWQRILSISGEITRGGSMSGRSTIWNAGLQAIPERPLLGAGAGAYAAAAEPYFRFTKSASAHNVFIGLLVEEGIVGLALFAAIFVACARTILRSPSPHRELWAVLMTTWLIGGLSGGPEAMKITWVLFGLVSAQSGMSTGIRDVAPAGEASATARRVTRLRYHLTGKESFGAGRGSL